MFSPPKRTGACEGEGTRSGCMVSSLVRLPRSPSKSQARGTRCPSSEDVLRNSAAESARHAADLYLPRSMARIVNVDAVVIVFIVQPSWGEGNGVVATGYVAGFPMNGGKLMVSTPGKVLSVNVGTVRELEYDGRPAKSAIWKSPAVGRIAARGVNLAGDDQADR